MNLPKNLTISLPTKRFIAFAIDFALTALIGILLFSFWGTKGLFDQLGGNILWQEAMEFYGTSHLYDISKNDDGSWGTDYSVLNYTVEASSTQEKPGYELYLDRVYLFYSDFLATNEHIDSVNGLPSNEVYSGKYFNTVILGLPEDVSSANILDETTYCTNYWKYSLNEEGTAIDQYAKPCLVNDLQELVSLNDKTTLTTLYQLFYHATSSKDAGGYFYDALKLLSDQSYLVPIGKEYFSVNWKVNAITFSIPIAFFFLLFPLCTPNGESLGKLVMKMGIAKKDGSKIGIIQRLFRPLVVLALVSVFIIVPRNYLIFTLVGMMLLLFIDFVFVLRDKSGAYRALQDRMVGSLVYDKKKSTILKTVSEVEQFASESEVVLTQNKETLKAVDEKAILADVSIINLDSLEEVEEIDSYDAFENKEDK